ncbi:BON domain-containing protein [Halomonas halocynthiae]|uniref:BON domain-containing protein n=1 Tax=Halomonas halocynthiae TaxID=176290 RepID=UPI00041DB33B|nr:BON domain-containing protein [Halomonas halocynthiae]
MSIKHIFIVALATMLISLSGCETITTATNPDVISENYGERTRGAKVEDDSIEVKVKHNMKRTDARLGDAHINVDSFNGVVLLTGQVPSEELRQEAERIASQVRNVRRVLNELSVAANSPASQRLNDTWITTRVRTTLASNDTIESSRLHVITENSSVYLMGIVSRSQADHIVNVVTSVGGMQRVVKAFDYLD